MQIINYLKTLNYADLTAALSFLGGGAGISVFLQTVKHKFELFEAEHKKWLTGILGVLSFATSAAYYLITHSKQTPAILVPYTTFLFTAATFWYRIAVNPVYTKKILPFLKDLTMIKMVSQPQKTTPSISPAIAASLPTEFPD